MTTNLTRQEYRVDGLPEPVSHYTDAVRVGNLTFVSGMIAMGPDGQIIGEGDVVRQTEVVHDYLGLALSAVGSSFAQIAKVTVYVTDIDHRQAIDSVRRRRFGDRRPASTLVQISALVIPQALVEIDAVAVVGS